MSLRAAALKASRWTAMSSAAAAVIQILQTSILARILLPEEFGLMAVVTAMIAVVSIAADMGLTQALVHYREMPAEHRSSIFWINILLAVVLMALLWLLSSVASGYFQSPEIAPLLQATSLVFLLSAAGQQLRACATRDLRFDDLARIEVLAAAFAGICAIAAALMNAGPFALAVSVLANAAMSSTLAWTLLPRHYRPGRHFSPAATRPYWSYSSYLAGDSLINALQRNIDVFVGGLAVGANTIGMYSLPRDLSLRMSTSINSIVTRIGFPLMATVKEDREKLKLIYLHSLRMTASINFPIYAALGIFADDIVAVLYGPRWQEAAIYLKILSAWGLIRSTGNPVGSLLYAAGQTRRAFLWNGGLLVALPGLYWASAHWNGIIGLAWATVTIQSLLVVPSWLFLVRPCCGATLREFFAQFISPFTCALFASIAAWGAMSMLPDGMPRTLTGCACGATIYLAASRIFNRTWLATMWELVDIRNLRKKI